MSFVVAIDGPAAAGKGTIARAVAEHLGFAHLDTGLLYRAVGRLLLDRAGGVDLDQAADVAQTLRPEYLDRDDLRTAEVAQAASRVAALPAVRAALVAFQHEFAARPGGAVLDGRDIGTVICPDADVKLFVTASAEVRAERRFQELSAKTPDLRRADVLADVIARDRRDAERDTAPMVAAKDAVEIDTSSLSIEAAIEQALAVIKSHQD